MFNCSNQSFIDTLPRSESVMEVDFACPDSLINNEKKNGFEIQRTRSFTTHFGGDSGSNGHDDSEGSSIIDLRSFTTSGDQWRSRSLDTLDEPFGERRPSGHRNTYRSSRRSLKINGARPKSLEHGKKTSNHTSLQEISQESKRTKNLDDEDDDDWSKENEFFSRNRIRKELNKMGGFQNNPRSSRRYQDNSAQVFMRKPSKRKGDSENPVSPPCSPTFSFKSNVSLIPSSERKRGIRQQIVVTLSCSLAPLACGFAVAYNLIKNPQNLITPELGFWSQYIFILGGVVGSFFSGIVSNHGRKIPLFICMSILLLGWMSIIFSVKVWMILVFHGLSGACTSVILVLSQIYIAEISLPYIRGSLSCTPLMALHVGILICLLLGDTMSWKNLAITGASIITPFFVAVALSMPESPRYLVHGSPTDSLAILQWLRGFNNDVMEEYRDIADFYTIDKWSLDKDQFGSPSFWRPLLVTCVLMFLHNMSGIASIAMYGDELFMEMSLSYPNVNYIIMISITIIGIIISSLLVDQVGRKLLLLLSLTIMSASAFALGLFLFLKDLNKVKTYFVYQWAAEVFCIVLFTLAHSAAVAPLAWITLGEIFGPRLKWVGVSIASMVMWSTMLIVDITYHKISIVIATGGLFWFHCIICVGGYIFSLLFFRELRDHKLDDINKVYLRKNDNLIDTFITKI